MRIIAGKHRGRKIDRVNLDSTRETADIVREAVFSMIGEDIYDKTVLDLFSGSGSYGLESLSRGAKFAYMVDINNTAITTIINNVLHLKEVSNAKIIKKDYQRVIKDFNTNDIKVDIIFLDPPYNKNLVLNVLMSDLSFLNKGNYIVCELDKSDNTANDIDNYEVIREKIYGTKKIIIYRLVK